MDAVEPLRERIAADLRAALKAREAIALSTLRSLLGTLDNATAVPVTPLPSHVRATVTEVPRRALTLQEVQAILLRELQARNVAAEEYERLGIAAQAARLRIEAHIVERYLNR